MPVLRKTTEALFIISIILSLIILMSLSLSGRALFLDELTLIQSVLTRSFSSLFSSPLDYSQNAPPGFLIIVKALTLLFGSNAFVIRLISFICYIGNIILSFFILKNIFKCSNPYVGIAIIASFSFFIYYAAEFKPYMSDTFFIFLCLYMYYLCKINKLSIKSLLLLYSLIVWFSFSAIFIISSILIYEFVYHLFHKEWNDLKIIILYGFFVAISLLVYYFLWILPGKNNFTYEEYEYWRHLNFPLLIKNRQDLVLIKTMFLHIFNTLGNIYPVYLVLFLFGIFFRLSKKCNYTIIILICFFILLIASYLGFFPIQNRLMLFVYPIIIIFSAISVDFLSSKNNVLYLLLTSLAFFILYSNFHVSFKYLQKENALRYGTESTVLVDYLEQNRKTNEAIYVYAKAIPIYSYKTNYRFYSKHYLYTPLVIEPTNKNDSPIIFGSIYYNLHCQPYKYFTDINTNALNENINEIIKNKTCYLLFSHISQGPGDIKITSLLEGLEPYGSSILVKEGFGTYLYKFTRGHL